MLRNIFQWFVYSSTNPQVISLTLKGLIPLLVLFGIDASVGDTLVDTINQLVLNLGLVFSGFLTLYGIVRKVWLTFK